MQTQQYSTFHQTKQTAPSQIETACLQQNMTFLQNNLPFKWWKKLCNDVQEHIVISYKLYMANVASQTKALAIECHMKVDNKMIENQSKQFAGENSLALVQQKN